MEINKILTGLGPYDQAKLEKTEADAAKTRKDRSVVESRKGDQASFSEEAKLRAEAYSSAMATPDERREKIEAIKAQIQSGVYQVDTRKIAENLVKEDLELLL